jgi:hypothetical protein
MFSDGLYLKIFVLLSERQTNLQNFVVGCPSSKYMVAVMANGLLKSSE